MSDTRLNDLLAAAQQRAEAAEIEIARLQAALERERDAALAVADDSARQCAILRRLTIALCDSEIAYSTHTSTVSRAALLALRAAAGEEVVELPSANHELRDQYTALRTAVQSYLASVPTWRTEDEAALAREQLQKEMT